MYFICIFFQFFTFLWLVTIFKLKYSSDLLLSFKEFIIVQEGIDLFFCNNYSISNLFIVTLLFLLK